MSAVMFTCFVVTCTRKIVTITFQIFSEMNVWSYSDREGTELIQNGARLKVHLAQNFGFDMAAKTKYPNNNTRREQGYMILQNMYPLRHHSFPDCISM